MKRNLLLHVIFMLVICSVWGCVATKSKIQKEPVSPVPEPTKLWEESNVLSPWVRNKILEDRDERFAPYFVECADALNEKVRRLETEGRIRDALWVCEKAAAEKSRDQCDPELSGHLKEKSRKLSEKAYENAQKSLAEGFPQKARRFLLEGLYYDPDHARILDGLIQIDHHPYDVYEVAPGDTLSEIAKKYYDESELYRVIAAANHIMNSDFLKAKDMLLIPVFIPHNSAEPDRVVTMSMDISEPVDKIESTDMAEPDHEPVPAEPIGSPHAAPPSDVSEPLDTIEPPGDEKDVAAIQENTAERTVPKKENIPQLEEPPIDPLLVEAKRLFALSRDNEAAAVCEKLVSKNPTNRQALELRNEIYLKMGNRLLEKEDYEMALMVFHKVDPGHEKVESLISKAKKKLADKYYLSGVKFFTQELLDKAIEAFEKVLFLDPSHPHAIRDLEEVRRLKEKLEKIQ